MLKPSSIREVKGDRPRMWMMDEYMDLILWYLPDGGLYGFQMCYDKEWEERSLTWTHKESFTHTSVDSGETSPLDAKGTPMQVAGGVCDYEQLRDEFQKRSTYLDPSLRAFLLSKLCEANLTKLPASAERGIFLKYDEGEVGPFSGDEILERIRDGSLPAEPLLRFHGEDAWRPVAEFLPDQFPCIPRGISQAVYSPV